MDVIELAPLFEATTDCRQVVRLCSTTQSVRSWCKDNVRLFAAHMAKHPAFRPFYEGVVTLPQYRDACERTRRLVSFRNKLELLLRIMDGLRRQRNIRVLLFAIEYGTAADRVGARIELDMIDPVKESLLLKSSPHSGMIKLDPRNGDAAVVTLAKTKTKNMIAASRILAAAHRLSDVDLSRVSLPSADDLGRIVRQVPAHSKYVAIRMNLLDKRTQTAMFSDADSHDIREVWSL